MIYRVNRRWNDFMWRSINHFALSALTKTCVKIFLCGFMERFIRWSQCVPDFTWSADYSRPCFGIVSDVSWSHVLPSVAMQSGEIQVTFHILSSSSWLKYCLLPASCRFLAWLTLRPWRWRRYVPPKYRIIWRYTAENKTLHTHRYENLSSTLVLCCVREYKETL
jgi:hypothetical protein